MPVSLPNRVNSLNLQEAKLWFAHLIDNHGGLKKARLSFSSCGPCLLPYESGASEDGACIAVFWSGDEFINSGLASERQNTMDEWARDNLLAFLVTAFEDSLPVFKPLPFIGMLSAIESHTVVFEALDDDNLWRPIGRLRASEYRAFETCIPEEWCAVVTRYECTVPGWVEP